MLSSSTLTPGSPKKLHERPSVFCLTSFCTVASGRCRTAATRADCSAAYAGEMSGSIPDAEVVTASTGIWWIVRPGLYGPSSLRIAAAAAFTFVARSELVGPRFANVVAAALYAGEVADGRSWK